MDDAEAAAYTSCSAISMEDDDAAAAGAYRGIGAAICLGAEGAAASQEDEEEESGTGPLLALTGFREKHREIHRTLDSAQPTTILGHITARRPARVANIGPRGCDGAKSLADPLPPSASMPSAFGASIFRPVLRVTMLIDFSLATFVKCSCSIL